MIDCAPILELFDLYYKFMVIFSFINAPNGCLFNFVRRNGEVTILPWLVRWHLPRAPKTLNRHCSIIDISINSMFDVAAAERSSVVQLYVHRVVLCCVCERNSLFDNR